MPGGIEVYNLSVADGATYFVDDGQGDASAVWVHNARIRRSIFLNNAAQETKTAGHRMRSLRIAANMAERGGYQLIAMHRAYSTVLRSLNLNVRISLRLPDVIGIRKNGKIDVIEVASKTDLISTKTISRLIERNRSIFEQLPREMRGQIKVVEINSGKVVARLKF